MVHSLFFLMKCVNMLEKTIRTLESWVGRIAWSMTVSCHKDPGLSFMILDRGTLRTKTVMNHVLPVIILLISCGSKIVQPKCRSLSIDHAAASGNDSCNDRYRSCDIDRNIPRVWISGGRL